MWGEATYVQVEQLDERSNRNAVNLNRNLAQQADGAVAREVLHGDGQFWDVLASKGQCGESALGAQDALAVHSQRWEQRGVQGHR